jgi:hypothetical protein
MGSLLFLSGNADRTLGKEMARAEFKDEWGLDYDSTWFGQFWRFVRIGCLESRFF